jgi:hypothetical protein
LTKLANVFRHPLVLTSVTFSLIVIALGRAMFFKLPWNILLCFRFWETYSLLQGLSYHLFDFSVLLSVNFTIVLGHFRVGYFQQQVLIENLHLLSFSRSLGGLIQRLKTICFLLLSEPFTQSRFESKTFNVKHSLRFQLGS